ncbi:HPr family phosphocarrier protein [Alterinioella nitratireducens]|jgi:phosphocarrier protein|uniref:HPr family phosphocarrier protein n=1 Tax=Alterinioella nitratireducens TaxID=2735915 RepID=UPI000C66F949|nr:HPr family phosphocarrier protein [Alterinioella nitratireducens]MAN14851.1 HPr family phosphocarrier protein [Dinoroseobacter sp.]MAX73501.1 HPr family phosphocarrier protein [Nioella sp.]NPD20006.1 HPr family phosphocarrier protein [Alterinioella nitratireducens]|tara:strand:- start:699 stop:977 length:279 start_codon:yes stop_codon:yes gene_type:complete
MSGPIRQELKIVNVKGLHARASAKFVEAVEEHDATATVYKDGLSAAGDSIMGLLMLAASVGTTIEVEISGPEAAALAEALAALVADKFGEGM